MRDVLVIIFPAAAPSGHDHEKWLHHWGGVSNRTDKSINFRHGVPPPLRCTEGGRFGGADSAPPHHAFSLLQQSDSLELCCCFFFFRAPKWQRGQSLLALPEISPFTPAEMAKENTSPSQFMIPAHSTHAPPQAVSSRARTAPCKRIHWHVEFREIQNCTKLFLVVAKLNQLN